MASSHDDPPPPIHPRGRPGPKPRGRSVTPLTITVTLAQRVALIALADAQKISISAVVRQFIAVGLTGP